MNTLRATIRKNISYIKSHQEADGSFKSFSGDEEMQLLIEQKTPFVTSLILCALGEAKDDPEIKKICDKALPMLLREKSSHWTWNYWLRNSSKAKLTPVPDDLDDTFCALSAIYLHKPSLISNEILPRVVKILTMSEVQVGGPYNTWIIKDIRAPQWHDIDVVVNSNVGYFLKLLGVEIDSLESLAEEVIRKKLYRTRYYKTYHSVLYFISRFYKGPQSPYAIQHIMDEQLSNGTWGNPLQTAQCIIALLNFGFLSSGNADRKNDLRLKRSIEFLKKISNKSSWEIFPCYIEESKEFPSYAGSKALTAAFVTEALLLYEKHMRRNLDNPKIRKREEKERSAESRLKQSIIVRVNEAFSHTAREIKDAAEQALHRILSHDKLSQVPLLPYFTMKAMNGGRKNTKRQNEIALELGIANTFGWLAYTIYDDVLDEDGDPAHISTANIALRELTQAYGRFASDRLPAGRRQSFLEIFKKVMDGIDATNYWERMNCKIDRSSGKRAPNYGDYSSLADKSLGHALSPVAILFASGLDQESADVKDMMTFFRHYIIAKQINDDAHDWQADLEKGFVNSVSSRFANLDAPITELQRLFWSGIIDDVCKDITTHAEQAKAALTRVTSVKDPAYFLSLLAPIQKSADEALAERDSAKDFLASY